MPMTMLIFVNYAHLSKKCRNYALLFTLNLVKTPLYKLYNKQVNGKHNYSVYTIRVYVRFPFSPKFRKFRLEIKWNGSFWFGPTGIFGTTFDRSAHFRQIGLKGPFPFDKIIVPSVTFLHPSYKNWISKRAVAWVRSGQLECTVPWTPLGMEFPNFRGKPAFLLKGKHPMIYCLATLKKSKQLTVGIWIQLYNNSFCLQFDDWMLQGGK